MDGLGLLFLAGGMAEFNSLDAIAGQPEASGRAAVSNLAGMDGFDKPKPRLNRHH